jgi:hypothetical protein
MTTLKTPTRIVELSLTSTNSDGTIGIDWSSDYIGNTSAPENDLSPCDCTDAEHSYHCDDDTADWWIEQCRAQQEHDDALAELSEAQRAEFDEEVEARHTYDVDMEQQPGAGMALMQELFGESVEIVEIGPSLGDCSDDEYASECARLEGCYTEVEGDRYSVTVRPARAGEASGTYLRMASGDLQILGYSLEIESTCPGLHEIKEFAWALYCKGA